MLISSFLLLLVGAGLLIAGLVVGSNGMLVGAIVASLVAAVCLYAASRRPRPAAEEPRERARREPSRDADVGGDARLRERDRQRSGDVREDATHPAERVGAESPPPPSRRDEEPAFDVDIDSGSDEPPEIPMSSVEAAALMRMDAEVMVVDGRPRFHLGGCVHLIGRDFEPLPAYEAVELGFTACSLCRPAQSLLGEPSRR